MNLWSCKRVFVQLKMWIVIIPRTHFYCFHSLKCVEMRSQMAFVPPDPAIEFTVLFQAL